MKSQYEAPPKELERREEIADLAEEYIKVGYARDALEDFDRVFQDLMRLWN